MGVTAGCEIILIFPFLTARQAAEQEEEVRGGAEGNFFPLPLPREWRLLAEEQGGELELVLSEPFIWRRKPLFYLLTGMNKPWGSL